MAHESFEVLKSRIDEAAATLAIGSLWRHFRTGSTYQIDLLPIHEETDMPEIVIYHDVAHPEVPIDAPLGRFFEVVEVDGGLVPRFEKLD
jgi:hypothetical protein